MARPHETVPLPFTLSEPFAADGSQDGSPLVATTSFGENTPFPASMLRRSSTMKSGITIPSRNELVACDHTVAGHGGTMIDPDGELFIKPCIQAEIDFYNSANRRYPDFAELMPVFYGELSLSDMVDSKALKKGIAEIKAQAAHHANPAAEQENTPPATHGDNGAWVPNHASPIKTDLSIVLENGTAGFKKPNILDAKLGERLWADDAPAEKKRRFDKVSAETTSGSLGFRIAGMRVYRGSDTRGHLDEEDFRVYDKDYGRVSIGTDNINDAFRAYLYNPDAGFDKPLSGAIVTGFLHELRHVEDVLSRHESRMYSASLLFIFEGEGPTLRSAIEENNKFSGTLRSGDDSVIANATIRTGPKVDSGVSLSDDEDNESDEGGESEPELPKMFSLKLIDFAHASWVPGQGPDENVLKGIRSLISIFEKLSAEYQ